MEMNEILKDAIKTNNPDIVKMILKKLDLDYQDKQQSEFNRDFRNVLENINPVNELNLTNVTQEIHRVLCGSNIGYRVNVNEISGESEKDRYVEITLEVFHTNGYHSKESSLKVSVKNDADQRTVNTTIQNARLLVLINEFNIVKENNLEQGSSNIRLSPKQNAEIKFPDTMSGALLEQTRKETEENIKILAENRKMRPNDVMERICVECGVKASARSNFDLKTWKLLNRKVKSFLAA